MLGEGCWVRASSCAGGFELCALMHFLFVLRPLQPLTCGPSFILVVLNPPSLTLTPTPHAQVSAMRRAAACTWREWLWGSTPAAGQRTERTEKERRFKRCARVGSSPSLGWRNWVSDVPATVLFAWARGDSCS